MSHLMSSFEQRQTQAAPPSVSGDTISSYDAKSLPDGDAFPDYNEFSNGFDASRQVPTIYNIQGSKDIKIGERVTQIYTSCMSHGK